MQGHLHTPTHAYADTHLQKLKATSRMEDIGYMRKMLGNERARRTETTFIQCFFLLGFAGTGMVHAANSMSKHVLHGWMYPGAKASKESPATP